MATDLFITFAVRALAALCGCALIGCASPSMRDYEGVVSIGFDNDEQMGSDNNYTHGGIVAWASNEVGTYSDSSFIRRWADFWTFLPHVSDGRVDTHVAWLLGEEMFTPDDISDPDPPLDDQPYAGVLYFDSLLRTQSERKADTWTLRLGIVGPSSGADDSQNRAHATVGAEQPQGWDTQLPDEPILNVGYVADYLWRQGELGGSASWRLVPTAHGELGNYMVGLGGGLYGEVGWNLPAAFGGRKLFQGFEPALSMGTPPQNGWSVSFYGGLGGYGIAHFLPLDGTVFKASRSVDSNPWLGVASAGLAVRYKRIAMRTGLTYYTETFESERARVDFATWELAWYF